MPIDVRCRCGRTLQAKDEHVGKRAKCPECGQVLTIPGTPLPAYDVFISHSGDDKPTADAMCATLEANGIRCWIAPRDILPGMEWGEAIVDGINQCRVMVLIFSSKSNQSPQVSREIERAVAKGLVLIPFRIEDVPLSKTMEYFLSGPHWLDALTPPLESHLKKLLASVASFLEASPTAVGNDESPPCIPEKVERPRANGKLCSRVMILVAAPLLALIGIPAKWTKRQRIAVGVAVSMSLAFVLFSLILSLRPKDGTLVVDINDPAVTVQIFGEDGKLQIERQADNEIIEISVPPGRHRLRAEKSGYVPFIRELSISSGSKETIQVKLGPALPDPIVNRTSSTTPRRKGIVRTQVAPSVPNASTAVAEKSARLARQIRVFRGHGETVTSVAFSPDGTRVLTGSVDRTAILWDTNTAKQIRVFREHGETVSSVAFSPDGHRILTGVEDERAILWDADTAEQIHVFDGHAKGVRSVAFSPDGKRVFTGALDGVAILWDADTGERVRAFQGHSGEIYSVAFSPKGNLVLTGAQDRTAILWDADTGKQVRAFKGHPGEVLSVAFGPDGKRVFTGTRNGVAILWDVESGEQVRLFKGNSAGVLSVKFSGNGKRLLTADQDSLTVLWDADTGEQLLLFKGNGEWMNSVAFSPDDRSVLIGLSGMPHASKKEYLAILWDADISAEE